MKIAIGVENNKGNSIARTPFASIFYCVIEISSVNQLGQNLDALPHHKQIHYRQLVDLQ